MNTLEMYNLALLGRDIQESLSPEIYQNLIGQTFNYELWDIPKSPNFKELIEKLKSLNGLSITSPYKFSFIDTNIKYLNKFESDTQIINTLKILDGEVWATNTDYLACIDLVKKYKIENFETIILLGNGSMATMFKYILRDQNIPFKQYSRKINGDLNKVDYSDLYNSILINCCSKNYAFTSDLNATNTFWDINYNHILNVENIKKQSITYIDGLELLGLQARYALSFWGISY